jgi:HNH endonuclease
MKQGHPLDKNPNWKGGRQTDYYGYVLVKSPNHHFPDRHGYVKEHRLVWEKYHSCVLMPWAVVHHKNHIRDDNRIENLEICLSKSDHRLRFHGHTHIDRICNICQSDKTPNKLVKSKSNNPRYDYVYHYWYKDKNDSNKWLCNKCHIKQIRGKL